MMKLIQNNRFFKQVINIKKMNKLNLTLLMASLFFLLGNNIFAQHFQKVFSGNPYMPMNIFVDSASLDGLYLQAGDEIAVFDVDTATGAQLCVGVVVLTSEFLPSGYLAIVASADDPTTEGIQDGLIDNNAIIYRFWDTSVGEEVTLMEKTYNPGGDSVFVSLGTATVGLTAFSKLIWTGAVDTDWHNPANWNTNNTLIPDYGTHVEIPASVTTFPVVSNGNAECRTLLAKPGISVTVSGTNTLKIFQ